MKLILFLFISLSFSPYSYGQENDGVGPYEDVYHLKPVFKKGFNKGKIINTDKKRAVVFLDNSPLEKYFTYHPKKYTVANIYHNDRFYIAEIPKNSLKTVYFQKEPFGIKPLMAHFMLRFEFKEPVKLIAEVPSLEEYKKGEILVPLEKPLKLYDLLFSPEATGPRNKKEFSYKSAFGYNGFAFRVTSLTGRRTTALSKGHSTIIQDTLYFRTEKELNDTLKIALNRSAEYGVHNTYNMITNNCNAQCYRVVDDVRKSNTKYANALMKVFGELNFLVSKVMVFSRSMPFLSRFGIKWRGWKNKYTNVSYMENSPNFKKLAKKYKKLKKNKSCHPLFN